MKNEHGKTGRGAFAAKLVASVLAVALVSGAAIAAIAATSGGHPAPSAAGPVTTSSTPTPAPAAKPPTIGPVSGPINLLLIGTDTRTGQGPMFESGQADSSGIGNNDVTILVQISPKHDSARIVSFPRDLGVPVPACPAPGGGYYSGSSKAMLNTTLRKGIECPVATIKALTGVKSIDYAAMISFKGVIRMSVVVGGVPVCVVNGIDDPYAPLHLSPGKHVVKGPDALAFLRTRHGVGDGSDLGRIANQELFMVDLLRTMISKNVLSSPAKLWKIAQGVKKYMTLSSNLQNPIKLVSLAKALAQVPLQNITFLQYPSVYDPDNPNRVIPNAAAAAVVNKALQNYLPVKLTGPTGRGAVTAPKKWAAKVPAKAPKPDKLKSLTLPPSVTGQTAAQSTCSNGQG